jgi:hypothetical protein
MARTWNFEITPFRSVGPLRFGLSMDDVRFLLGGPEKEFVRNPQFAPDHVEWIYDGRAFVHFDSRGRCVGIMLAPPADPRLLGPRGPAAWHRRVMCLGQTARVGPQRLRGSGLPHVEEAGREHLRARA